MVVTSFIAPICVAFAWFVQHQCVVRSAVAIVLSVVRLLVRNGFSSLPPTALCAGYCCPALLRACDIIALNHNIVFVFYCYPMILYANDVHLLKSSLLFYLLTWVTQSTEIIREQPLL